MKVLGWKSGLVLLIGVVALTEPAAAQRPDTMVAPLPDTVQGAPLPGGVPDTVQGRPLPGGVRDTVYGVEDTIRGPIPRSQGRIILRSPIPERPNQPQQAPTRVIQLGVTAVSTARVQGQDTAKEHRVRRGDTLWDLARAYLGDPWQWRRIYDANREVVENPHWIYPAERLIIPGLGGTWGPALMGEPLVTAPEDLARDATPSVPLGEGLGESDLDEAARPAVTAAQFRSAPWLGDVKSVNAIGEFVRILDAGTITGANPSPRAVRPHDLIYLRYRTAQRPEIGEELLLVDAAEVYRGYGQKIVPTAVVRITALDREVMTGEIVHQFQGVERGDLLIPMAAAPDLSGLRAEPVDNGPRGLILAFATDHPLPTVTDRGFIDLGENHGVQVGDELVVYLPTREAETVLHEDLPAEPVARLRVVRTMPATSTFMVTGVAQPVLKAGLPVRVYRKIP